MIEKGTVNKLKPINQSNAVSHTRHGDISFALHANNVFVNVQLRNGIRANILI